jgi:glycosyltransferase involved in cell wall biosynthesis
VKIVTVMTTDSRGGAEFAAVEMLDALRARGHQAVMLSDQPGIARDTAIDLRTIDIGPKLSSRSWRELLVRWPQLVLRLRSALAREAPYDVLLLHYKKEQLLVPVLGRLLTPTVAWAEWGPVPFPLRRGLPRALYRLAARRAALIMAVSEGTRISVREVGVPLGKIHVVPNAMRADTIRFTAEGRARVRDALGIPEDAFVVGCISRFHPKKRNDVVVDAVAQLPGTHLILAGEGETESSLRERAAPMGELAHFMPTPRGYVHEVLSAFDVSVFCPSPTEGAPRAVILGMLAGRPCVSSGAEGVADIITPETGSICSPENDPATLAAILARYRNDPQLRARHGAAARSIAERSYAGPVVAERIERLLQAAITRSRADGQRPPRAGSGNGHAGYA